MCRHCERIKEDVESKPVVHAFMEHLAKNCNRAVRERGTPLAHEITADDIDITVHVNAVVKPLVPMENITVMAKMLREMYE